MRIQIAVWSINNQAMLADWTVRIASAVMRTNQHGNESLELEVRLPFYEAFNYYKQRGPLEIRVQWGPKPLWIGRIEDPTQFAHVQSGLKVIALGQWSALNDTTNITFWSKTGFEHFRPFTPFEVAGNVTDRYAYNTSNQVYIAPQKNALLGNTGTLKSAMVGYITPKLGARTIVGASFDFVHVATAAGWRAAFQTRAADFTGLANPWLIQSVGAGTVIGSFFVTFAAGAIVDFFLDFNAADAVNAAETGANYLKITNLRMVGSTTNQINTTITVVRTNGVGVTVTVGSTTNMYAGQRLIIGSGTANSESVLITSIASATTFVATIVNAPGGGYAIGTTVQAFLIFPDEIIKDIITTTNAFNSSQLSAITTYVQSQAIDVDQAVYEDLKQQEIVNSLIERGDRQAVPRQWSALVEEDKILRVQPRGSGKVWYTDIVGLDVARSLQDLYTQAYPVYDSPNDDVKVRLAATSDTAAFNRYGINRRLAVQVDTTLDAVASQIRDMTLTNQKDPIPQATVEIKSISDDKGNPQPLFNVRADDVLVLRNLPTLLGTAYDRIRVLVIVRTEYNLIENTIKLDLELPTPNTNVQLARALYELNLKGA